MYRRINRIEGHALASLLSFVKHSHGFSLCEVLIAMAVGLVLLGAALALFSVHHHEHHHQQMDLMIQQNMRGAMIILEQEIRMAGYDPLESGRFGITEVRRYSTMDTAPDTGGQPALFWSSDIAEENGLMDPNEMFGIRIRWDERLERTFLTISIGSGGRQNLAENIGAIGFAYAVDADGDASADKWNSGDHLVWAVDTDNDNLLDTNIDTNSDGCIDVSDDRNGDGCITSADGGALHPVGPDRIKMVRVWLLGVSPHLAKGHSAPTVFVVGDRIVSFVHDGFIRRVFDFTVNNRNL